MRWGIFCLMCLSCHAWAEPASGRLGRLFFTPEERAAMHRSPPAKHHSKHHSQKAKVVHFNGLIVRSSGHRTVWINGTPWHDDLPTGVNIDLPSDDPAQARLNVEGHPSRKIGE